MDMTAQKGWAFMLDRQKFGFSRFGFDGTHARRVTVGTVLDCLGGAR